MFGKPEGTIAKAKALLVKAEEKFQDTIEHVVAEGTRVDSEINALTSIIAHKNQRADQLSEVAIQANQHLTQLRQIRETQ